MATNTRDGTVKLTSKQELFVQGLISGKSQRQAYIDAGYKINEKRLQDVDERACKLFKNNKVSTRYEELMGEHKEKALWTREMAVEALQKAMLICTEDRTMSPFISAIKELNLLEDLYPKQDNININVDANSANIDSIKTTMSKLKGVKR